MQLFRAAVLGSIAALVAMVATVVLLQNTPVAMPDNDSSPPKPGAVFSREEIDAKVYRAEKALAEARAEHNDQNFSGQLTGGAATSLAVIGPALVFAFSFWLRRASNTAQILLAAPTLFAMLLLGFRWYGLLFLIVAVSWRLYLNRKAPRAPSAA